jgi:A/G-specific adenine glycosylase
MNKVKPLTLKSMTMPATQKNHKVSETIIHKISGELRQTLVGWYDENKRTLPWRATVAGTSDPYHVWLSEIMLQQTTVQAVKPYYTKFLALWPTVQDLAAAENDDVMAAWAGLGYYARARNLHKCAKTVTNEHGGKFPNTQSALKDFPGIGDYTSAAITTIAFNTPATVVDGNVERVIARVANVTEPMPHSKKHLKALAHIIFEGYTNRPGDLAQAFMDLGATICIPKAPRCVQCPLSSICEGLKAGTPEKLPAKIKKKPRPEKHGHVYWIENETGEVLLHRRPPSGLLGGMAALPTSEWSLKTDDRQHMDWLELTRGQGDNQDLTVDHVFSHFDLRLHLKRAKINAAAPPSGYFWSHPQAKGDEMPSLFAKAYKIFYPEGG